MLLKGEKCRWHTLGRKITAVNVAEETAVNLGLVRFNTRPSRAVGERKIRALDVASLVGVLVVLMR